MPPSDGPNLFPEGLDLGWAVLEGPWAIERGDATVQMCKDRAVGFIVDTQAWRYWDQRTFVTEKFTAVPYAPPRPLPDCNRAVLRAFVAACLETQDHLGATAFLLPGLVPRSASHDVHDQALELLETSRDLLPRGLPCFAFIGAHTSSIGIARNLVQDLPSWVTGALPVHTGEPFA